VAASGFEPLTNGLGDTFAKSSPDGNPRTEAYFVLPLLNQVRMEIQEQKLISCCLLLPHDLVHY